MWVLLFYYFTRNYRLMALLQQRHSREYLTVHTAIAARISLINHTLVCSDTGGPAQIKVSLIDDCPR